MKIVALDGYSANPGDLSWDDLSALGELTVYDYTLTEEVIPRISDAEAVLTNKVPITAQTMDACPNLKFICVFATGYNIVDVDAAKTRGITVSNIPAYSSASVAQSVFAFLLEIALHVTHHSSAVHSGRWTASKLFCFWDYPLMELEGKTLGIIGYGAIGQRVAKIAVAFGMKVLANNRTYRPELETENIKMVGLDEVLAESDFITLHCPQTPESAGLINRNTIAKMKDSAVVINTARGGCVVEQDVADALVSGKLSWYAADVLSEEPPKAQNPLLSAPHTIFTPHISWATFEARTRLMEIMLDNFKGYLAGSAVNVVNP